MKLQTKLSLSFGVTVLVAILAVGSVAYNACYSTAMDNISQSIDTSANLAAQQISVELESYKRMAEVTGEDPIIIGEADNTVKTDRINALAEDYGFTSGNILDGNGISIQDGTDFSDRDYVQRALLGEVVVSDITLSKYTNTYGFSVAAPIGQHDGDAVLGVVYYRMDIDFMQEILSHITIGNNSYAYITDDKGKVIVHHDSELIGVDDTRADGILYGDAPINMTNGWNIIVAAPESDFTEMIYAKIKVLIIMDIVAFIYSIIVGTLIARGIGKKANMVAVSLGKLAEGDLSSKVAKTSAKDEIGRLQNSTAKLQETFTNIINETNSILGAMANCDLTAQDMKAYPGEYNKMSNSVNDIKAILGQLIMEVQESASSVGVGSGQLADAADALSRGTVAQASSIDQVVVDVQEVADRIQRNSDNEQLVDDKLKNLEQLIQNGNTEMTHLLTIVREVEEMSADIQKIVGTIDSIAFQTNILALNASVEAARAGDNGKGFAVVADEVGSLAAKTSEASKQTSELIGRCIDGINSAMKSADTTFECLKEIVANSGEISMAFEEISNDTRQQAQKSSDIRREMGNISDVVQTNTATAQQTAAATQELSEQAKNLSALISNFKI